MNAPPLRRLRTPLGDGELLVDPPFVDGPEWIERNRYKLETSDIQIGDMPLSPFRQRARHELATALDLPAFDGPLILTGHQPELCHPGVWLKTFAAAGLAERVNGTAINLVVDTDELKSLSLTVSAFDCDPSRVHNQSVAFDSGPTDQPFAFRKVEDESLFASFPERVAKAVQSWPFEPMLAEAWKRIVDLTGTIGERFVAARSHYEVTWGCRVPTITVTRLCQLQSFQQFAAHILADLPQFSETYNAAVRDYRKRARLRSQTHPVPELAPDEAPFWILENGQRRPATAHSDPATLVPRALTLTLFARLCLGDWFIHGIGGGKYDDVTDTIIREYFGLEPPAFQVLTGTLRLPFAPFQNSDHDVKRLSHRLRDLHWNPQRYTNPEQFFHLIGDREKWHRRVELTTSPTNTKAIRSYRANEIRGLNEWLRPFAVGERERVERELNVAEVEASANAILRNRENPWLFFPEKTLKPFLQCVRAAAMG